MEQINKKLKRKLEDLGLDNLHSYSVILMVQNVSLFPNDVFEEFIHDSDMGEYLIKAGVIQKVNGVWKLPTSLFDNSEETKNWKKFKTLLFNDYGFTLKGHSDNPIGYLIKDEGVCSSALNELLKTADMEDILKEAEKYYKEGEYLKGLDKWLSEVIISSNHSYDKKNKFIN
mgnify:CR=1 FL=1